MICIFREINKPTDKNEKRYIVFDGDVDALWVENMNSVMDDNRLLTLANGERIRLQKHCALLFEVGIGCSVEMNTIILEIFLKIIRIKDILYLLFRCLICSTLPLPLYPGVVWCSWIQRTWDINRTGINGSITDQLRYYKTRIYQYGDKAV